MTQGSYRDGVRNQVDVEHITLHRIDRQADALDCHRTLACDVARQCLRRADAQQHRLAHRLELHYLANAIDMARYQMTADTIGQAHGFFQIHLGILCVQPDGAVKRLLRHIGIERCCTLAHHGQADAVDSDGVADGDILHAQACGFDVQAYSACQRFNALNFSKCGDDA